MKTHTFISPPIRLLKRFNKFTWVCCQENGNLAIFLPVDAVGLAGPSQATFVLICSFKFCQKGWFLLQDCS